jgi:hypothetical protein
MWTMSSLQALIFVAAVVGMVALAVLACPVANDRGRRHGARTLSSLQRFMNCRIAAGRHTVPSVSNAAMKSGPRRAPSAGYRARASGERHQMKFVVALIPLVERKIERAGDYNAVGLRAVELIAPVLGDHSQQAVVLVENADVDQVISDVDHDVMRFGPGGFGLGHDRGLDCSKSAVWSL